MNTYDLDRMFGEWMDAADAMAEPPTLLPSVFDVTRQTPQRRGLIGRIQSAFNAGMSWTLRPVLVYALIILLLLVMTFALALSAGLLRPAIPTGWRSLDVKEDRLGVYVNKIAHTPRGFVALTETAMSDQECRDRTGRAQLWTSPDGNSWVAASDRSLSGTSLVPREILSVGDVTYIFGSDCTSIDFSERTPSGGGWRSNDHDAWERLPDSPDIFQHGNVPYFAALDETLFALGYFQVPVAPGGAVPGLQGVEFGEPEVRVWSSTNGSDWAHLATLADFQIYSVAARDGVLVALGSRPNQPGMIVLRSADGGLTWAEQALPQGIPQSLAYVVAGEDVFVAAGDEVAVVSDDGRSWAVSTTVPAVLDGVDGLWAIPGGYLVTVSERDDHATRPECRAIGGPAQPVMSLDPAVTDPPLITMPPVPQETCLPVPASGGTALSRDGLTWVRGPDLPVPSVSGTSGPVQFQLAADDRSVVASEWGHGPSIWYSPLEPFITGR